MLKLRFLLFTLILLCGRVIEVLGRSCPMPSSVAEELRRSAVVFSGKVIKMDYRRRDGKGEILTVTFSVDRWWKGEADGEVTLYTSTLRFADGSMRVISTDFGFSAGERYLVYANGYEGRLSTSACTRTRRVELGTDDWKVLGEGRPPVKQRH